MPTAIRPDAVPIFLSCWTCLAILAACPPKQPSATDGDPATSDPASTTYPTATTDAPPTSGENSSGVPDGETGGAVEWTYVHDGNPEASEEAREIAIDGAGRIVVVGGGINESGDTDSLVIVLDPDGTEVWKRTYPGPLSADDTLSAVTVDAAGIIYVGGFEGTSPGIERAIVRALAPDGEPLWTFTDPSTDGFSNVEDLALTDGALYSLGSEHVPTGSRLFIRRHDPMTGDVAWKTATQADVAHARGEALAVHGTDLVAVGFVFTPDLHALVAVVTDAGELVSTAIDDSLEAAWLDIAPIGPDGDLVLVGHRIPGYDDDDDIVVQRVGPDLTGRWTRVLDHNQLGDHGAAVAIGPDETMFVVGAVDWGPPSDIWGALFTPDGEQLWTHIHDNPDFHGIEDGNAAAFGSGYVILAGREEVSTTNSRLWVRRLAAG
jgi:hypothetical protein